MGAADDAGRCPALAPDSGFEWTASQGPDFDVCYAHPPDTDNALFGLYIGYAASFRGRTDTPGEPGVVAGRDVRWFPHTGKDGDFPFGQETLLELDQGPDRGTLQRYISELGLSGLTSNPTIFDQALGGSGDYDADIRARAAQGLAPEALFFELALLDLCRAADLAWSQLSASVEEILRGALRELRLPAQLLGDMQAAARAPGGQAARFARRPPGCDNAQPMNTPDTANLALFCDFENVALGVRDARYAQFDISKVLERLLVKGDIVVKKAYCDWERYKDFKKSMHEAAFELIEQHLLQGPWVLGERLSICDPYLFTITGWLKGDDAWVVMDRNGNGTF